MKFIPHPVLVTRLLACSALLAMAPSPLTAAEAPTAPDNDSPFSFTLGSGWRRDELRWTIAGDSSGRNPNILSELDWTDLEIIPVSLVGELTFLKRWHLALEGSYGTITGGKNRDSDYNSNNRRGQFSRSRAETEGKVLDGSLLLGYDFPLHSRLILTPWAGVTLRRQDLNDKNGVSEIDTESGETGAFSGLDSKYGAEWRGGVLGLEGKLRLSDRWRLRAGFRYALLDYEGTGEWNLRDDMDGFKHTATGHGWQLQAGSEWDLAPRWTLGVSAFYGRYTTSSGTDETILNDGGRVSTRLNEVEWKTAGVNAAVTFKF